MKRSYFFLPTMFLVGVAQLPADVMVKSTYKTGNDTASSTVYVTKDRQRLESGGATLIRQNDRQRVIEIDQEARSWVAIPAAAPAAAPARKGGVVTVTTTVVDTGETKTALGMTARHLKSTTVTTGAPGACRPGTETVETDGWYVDIAYPDLGADGESAAGCVDEVRRQTFGPATGYPVALTSKTVRGKEETTYAMEVTALSTEPLPASLFEPPADYTERKSVAALAAARPKAAGTVRVGVVGVTDASGKQVPVAGLQAQLAALLNHEKVQAVELASAGDAEAAHCDFVLQSEVADVSKSAVGQVTGKVLKFGGMLSRRAAAPASQDWTEATVHYKLLRAGTAEGAVDGSARGKNGSALNLKTVAQLASMATPMGLMMRSMGGGGFGMFAAQWMGGGAGFGAPDPAMSMILRSVETHTGSAPDPAELAALRAALESEAKAVASAVKAGS